MGTASNGNGNAPTRDTEVDQLEALWASDERWNGISRAYGAAEVVRLRGSFAIEHTLARRGAERLWRLLNDEPYVNTLGALTGGQAVQMVKAGLKAIYLSGWQVAADGNLAGSVYPDQSLYPANSVPAMVRRLNNAMLRADRIEWSEGDNDREWVVPIVADAEAGFGGPLNAFELMNGMIEAGAAGVHYEDQLAAEKKCGHLGGKVLVPDLAVRADAERRAAGGGRRRRAVGARRAHRCRRRHAADERHRRLRPRVHDRRAHGGGLLPRPLRYRGRDLRAVSPTRRTPTSSGWRRRHPTSVRRGSSPRRSTTGSRASCSRTTAPRRSTGGATWTTRRSRGSRRELGELGYRFQFITLAGFHSLNAGMFELARGYAERGMSAYVELQEREFALEDEGYTATRHQREVGAGWFDEVAQAVSGGTSSTLALRGSTEEEQFTATAGGVG